MLIAADYLGSPGNYQDQTLGDVLGAIGWTVGILLVVALLCYWLFKPIPGVSSPSEQIAERAAKIDEHYRHYCQVCNNYAASWQAGSISEDEYYEGCRSAKQDFNNILRAYGQNPSD